MTFLCLTPYVNKTASAIDIEKEAPIGYYNYTLVTVTLQALFRENRPGSSCPPDPFCPPFPYLLSFASLACGCVFVRLIRLTPFALLFIRLVRRILTVMLPVTVSRTSTKCLWRKIVKLISISKDKHCALDPIPT